MSEEMVKKWFKYTIDYEYGMAVMFSKERPENPISLFYALAGECFGIRKSIGETKLIDEELVPIETKITSPKATGEQVMKMGMGEYQATMLHAMFNRESTSNLPKEKFDLIDFVLTHDGDLIAFNSKFRDSEGGYWKIMSEHGDVCTCKETGKEELSCEVHHFWVKNHDKICKEHKK